MLYLQYKHVFEVRLRDIVIVERKNIPSLNARYNIFYFCHSMGNATQIWVLLSSIAKNLHVLTTVPCNANASDSIIPNDLRIWSNNFSFPHLFWESQIRTQDWTLAITQGGQEPEQALIWCLAFITHSVFRGGHTQASTCCDAFGNWSNTSLTRLCFSVFVFDSNPTSLNTKRKDSASFIKVPELLTRFTARKHVTHHFTARYVSLVSLSVSLSQPQCKPASPRWFI